MVLFNVTFWEKVDFKRHSGRMDWKTVHSTIDTPPGVPGVSKNSQKNSQTKLLSFLNLIQFKLNISALNYQIQL